MYVAKRGFLCGARWFAPGEKVLDVPADRLKTLEQDGVIEQDGRVPLLPVPPVAMETAVPPPPAAETATIKPRRRTKATPPNATPPKPDVPPAP